MQLNIDPKHALPMSIGTLPQGKEERLLTEPGTHAARIDALWKVHSHNVGHSESSIKTTRTQSQ